MVENADTDSAIIEVIQITTAQVRKLARLTALHSRDAIVRIEQRDDSNGEYIQVEWLDEYGHRDRGGLNGGRRGGYAAVIREDGWSNPSVARVRERMIRGE